MKETQVTTATTTELMENTDDDMATANTTTTTITKPMENTDNITGTTDPTTIATAENKEEVITLGKRK